MANSLSPPLALRARGPLACFTRPEMKVERVSYPVMTPSAARGLLESILWKPAIRWKVIEIHVLAPIAFTSFRRNEVNSKAIAPSHDIVLSGGSKACYYADEDRAQRNTVALRDVDYLVRAEFSLTDMAGPEDNIPKFVEMFERRVRKGQHFQQPYFGCREFAAEILTPEDAPGAIQGLTKPLGVMLWDIEFGSVNMPLFFDARLVNGVMSVPECPIRLVRSGGEA